MFNLGLFEIIMVLLVALIVLGPERLPEVSKMIGHMMAQLKSLTQDAEKSLSIEDIKKQLKKPYDFTGEQDKDDSDK